MAHTLNPKTWKPEAGKSLSSRLAWSTELVPRQTRCTHSHVLCSKMHIHHRYGILHIYWLMSSFQVMFLWQRQIVAHKINLNVGSNLYLLTCLSQCNIFASCLHMDFCEKKKHYHLSFSFRWEKTWLWTTFNIFFCTILFTYCHGLFFFLGYICFQCKHTLLKFSWIKLSLLVSTLNIACSWRN